MHSMNPRGLFTSLLLGAGALAAILVAVHAGKGWTVLGAPLLLALVLLAADMWEARRRGLALRPSLGMLMLAVSVVVAALIVGMGDSHQVQGLIPVLAAVSAVAISTRSHQRRCGRIASHT